MGPVPREAAMMRKHHEVEKVEVEKGILHLIVDGNNIQCELKELSPLLAAAKHEELKELEVSPSGYGIHWPKLDDDISIDGLLGIVHKPDAKRKSA